MMSNFLLHFAHLAVKRLWVLLKLLTLADSLFLRFVPKSEPILWVLFDPMTV